jgi:hypothetical protein
MLGIGTLPLSLCYINDLPDNVSGNFRLFADDTVVNLTIKSPKDTQTLQKNLNSLWKLEIQLVHGVKSRKMINP